MNTIQNTADSFYHLKLMALQGFFIFIILNQKSHAVTRHLTKGMRSEQCAIRWLRHRANVTEYTHTNPDGLAHCTPRLCGLACCSWATSLCSMYCTEQHRSQSSTRESDAVKKHGEHEMCEAAAGVTRPSVLATFLSVERIYSNDKNYSMVHIQTSHPSSSSMTSCT